MIPMGRLSTQPVSAAFISPDDTDGVESFEFGPLTDYELGGKDISDASEGLEVKIWKAEVTEAGEVYFSAPEVPQALYITLPGTTEFSFTFDQNMRPVLAYMQAGEAKFRWYDALTGTYVTTTLPVGSNYPKVALDDKREYQTTLGDNDVILAYLRAGTLYYRQQRDRYEVEYTLASVPNARLLRIGMNMVGRLQFLFEEI